MSDTLTLYNNRLGITTLAPPKELDAGPRAALSATLRLQPGGSVTLRREFVALMMRRPGNWGFALSGEISTRRREVGRHRPPTNLEKLDRKVLRAPKGVSDFVYGLEPDPVLVAMVEDAQRARASGQSRDQNTVARLATEGSRLGDYQGLLAALAGHGVSIDELRSALTAPAPGTRKVDLPPPPPPVPLAAADLPPPPPPVPLAELTPAKVDLSPPPPPVPLSETSGDKDGGRSSGGSGRRK